MAADRRSERRLVGVCLSLVLALAGCSDGGFRPLYGPSASGALVTERLAEIDIAPIPSRVGQLIRNELIFHNTGGAGALPPKYRLEIAVREGINSTLVNRTGEAMSQVYSLDTGYKLISIKDKRVVLSGQSHARATFERFTSIYSNVRAREDAEARAARTIAEEMRLRLATFLSREPT